MGERKQLLNVLPLPTTLTYNPRLAKVVDPRAKNQGKTVQTREYPQTNGRTDATKRIAPAMRSITITKVQQQLLVYTFSCLATMHNVTQNSYNLQVKPYD